MRFTIPKGQDFYCEFEIKEPGTSTPMDITGCTGIFNLSTLGFTCTEAIKDAPMVIQDAVNGVISLSLTADQTKDLISEVGFAEDGYAPIATYKGRVDITGLEKPISVDIRQIYISDMGCT